MGNNASTFYLGGVEDCTMKSFVREEEEEAVCKSPWCSESLTYTVTLRETHSPALFLQQEHTPRHVTLPNVRFKDYFKKRKVLEDHWFSTFFFSLLCAPKTHTWRIRVFLLLWFPIVIHTSFNCGEVMGAAGDFQSIPYGWPEVSQPEHLGADEHTVWIDWTSVVFFTWCHSPGVLVYNPLPLSVNIRSVLSCVSPVFPSSLFLPHPCSLLVLYSVQILYVFLPLLNLDVVNGLRHLISVSAYGVTVETVIITLIALILMLFLVMVCIIQKSNTFRLSSSLDNLMTDRHRWMWNGAEA